MSPMFRRLLREYNKCHNPKGEAGGKFCSDPQSGSKGDGVEDRTPMYGPKGPAGLDPRDTAADPAEGPQKGAPVREPVIHVDTVEEAAELLLQGHNVEVDDVRDVNTLIKGLAAMALDAQSKGEDAPDYDLCQVSVAGTNLFCTDRMRDAANPEGVERYAMPQIGGMPVPGSRADELPKSKSGAVNAIEDYKNFLNAMGIDVADVQAVPASRLKATQAELVGSNVGWMMNNTDKYAVDEPIFISRDNYIVDGHHRWAAQVGLDAQDGRLGQSTMNVFKIDAPISEVIKISQQWTKEFGIKGKKAVDRKKRVNMPKVRLRSGATSRSPIAARFGAR